MQGGGGGEFNGNFVLLDYKSMHIREFTMYYTYKLNSYMYHIVYIPMSTICTFVASTSHRLTAETCC